MKKFSDLCIALLPNEARIAYKIALNWPHFGFHKSTQYYKLTHNGILYITCPTGLKTQLYYSLATYISVINTWLGFTAIQDIKIIKNKLELK